MPHVPVLGRPNTPAGWSRRLVPVPVSPRPAIREAPARPPAALLLDVCGQPAAEQGRSLGRHTLPGGACRCRLGCRPRLGLPQHTRALSGGGSSETSQFSAFRTREGHSVPRGPGRVTPSCYTQAIPPLGSPCVHTTYHHTQRLRPVGTAGGRGHFSGRPDAQPLSPFTDRTGDHPGHLRQSRPGCRVRVEQHPSCQKVCHVSFSPWHVQGHWPS